MRVAIDIDNVIVDWQGHWIDLYTQWFDREVDPEVAGTWDALTTGTHFEDAKAFFNWFQYAGGWDTLPHVAGAQGALYQLRQLQVPFVFVTARPTAGEESARLLARQWGTGVQFLHAQSKHLAGADIWVDDSPEVLENLYTRNLKAIRFEAPWNSDAPATHSAADWPAAIEILKGML